MDLSINNTGLAYMNKWKGTFVRFYHRKDNPVMYRKIHYWLWRYVAKAPRCVNPECRGNCAQFNWSLKPMLPYDFKIKNFDFLCNSCNQLRDQTKDKIRHHQKIRQLKRIRKSISDKNRINTKNYYSNPKNREAQSLRIKKALKNKRNEHNN